MDFQEKLVRGCIFTATGYLCSGIVVTLLAGLSYWAEFLGSSQNTAVVFTLGIVIVSGVLGIMLMRFLVPRYGLKPIFEQDVLILMIGLLFVALSINRAMMMVGLAVTAGATAVYFFENYKLQVNAARGGFISALRLSGWAAGPVISVLALQLFAGYGLITIRLIFAHYIIIAFWVWIQRLNLHMDYHDAPDSIITLVHKYQRAKGLRKDKKSEKAREKAAGSEDAAADAAGDAKSDAKTHSQGADPEKMTGDEIELASAGSTRQAPVSLIDADDVPGDAPAESADREDVAEKEDGAEKESKKDSV